MVKEKRVLPADVYDTFEFSALVFGGVGAEIAYDENDAPVCALGHAHFTTEISTRASALMTAHRPSIWANDAAVHAINERKGVPLSRRVSWKEYCAELNIVRGD